MNNAKFKAVNDIVVGISRRAQYKFKTKDAEELAQDLWIALLEKGVGDATDLNLVARICYGEITDIIRRDCRRNAISLNSLLGNSFDSAIGIRVTGNNYSDLNTSVIYDESAEVAIDNMIINDLFHLFPEGSQEHTYITYWATASKVKDFGIVGHDKYHEGYTENDLAHRLGYPSSASATYRKFRQRMRNFIKVYFDLVR